MIKVLVAYDHPVVRQGLLQILGATEDIVVAGEATSGHEVLERARCTECDVVILDLSMPGIDGLDVLKQLKRERPRLPVLILTMHAEDQFAIRALKAGASGYLTKESAPAQLVGAIRRVFGGGRYISAQLAERLADHLDPEKERFGHEKLSDREYHVLRLIAAGRTTREISADLSLSVKTISTYRSRIFEKMQMKTPAELAAYVVRNRLTD